MFPVLIICLVIPFIAIAVGLAGLAGTMGGVGKLIAIGLFAAGAILLFRAWLKPPSA